MKTDRLDRSGLTRNALGRHQLVCLFLLSLAGGLSTGGLAGDVQPESGDSLPETSFQRLTPETGLSSSYVTALAQDQEGYVWIGTADGLNRYDGYECRVFRYHPEDASGISGSYVNELSLDGHGLLWVLPGIGGADVYDPVNERFVHLAFRTAAVTAGTAANPPVVTGIVTDAFGRVWIATRRGLFVREHPGDTDVTREAPEDNGDEGDAGAAVNALVRDPAGTLWVGGENGLTRLDPVPPDSVPGNRAPWSSAGPDGFRLGRFRTVPLPDQDSMVHVSALALSPTGDLWVGTPTGTVLRLEPRTGRWRRFGPSSSTLAGSARPVRLIRCDSLGGAWIARRAPGVEYADDHGTLRPARFGPLERSDVNDLEFMGEDVLLGTDDGLVRLDGRFVRRSLINGDGPSDPGRSLVARYSADDPTSLSADLVTAILRDRRGGIWIGTLGGGVCHDDPRQARFHSAPWPPPGLGDPSVAGVNAVLEDAKGRLWIGTAGGLVRRDGEDPEFRVVRIRRDGDNTAVSHSGNRAVALACFCVMEDRSGCLWVGTSDGLARVIEDGRSVRFEFTPLSGPRPVPIRAMAEDPREGLWLATDRGLRWIDPILGTSRQYVPNPADSTSLPSASCVALAFDRQGELWVGTHVGGLSRFDSARDAFENFVPGRPRGLNNLSVQTICPSRDGRTLWVGTYSGGLNRLDLSSRRFEAWTERQGLPGDKVNAVLEDTAGRLWVTTNRGLARVDPRSGGITSFDAGDGLPGNEFLPRAACLTRGGEMIVGGSAGYCRFDPERIVSDPFPPPVVLTAFRSFDRVLPLGRVLDARGRIALSYREDFVSFEFAALEYATNPRAQYAYRLDGFDSDWIHCGSRRYAAYTNLDPGRYVFHVRAANRDGVWNEAGLTIPLIITPPFWRTPWFGGLLVLFASVSLLGLHQWGVRARLRRSLADERIRTAERERVRGEVARDYHDEVGVQLTRISLHTELLRRRLDGLASLETQAYLGKIAESAQVLTRSTRDFLWTLDPGKNRIADLLSHLDDLGRPLFDGSDTLFEVPLADAETAQIVLSPKRKRQLALLLREALHNARKHARAAHVRVTAARAGSCVQIEVQDDGRGFNVEAAAHAPGQGLANLRARAAEAGGRISIRTAPGEGTRVRFEGDAEFPPNGGVGTNGSVGQNGSARRPSSRRGKGTDPGDDNERG